MSEKKKILITDDDAELRRVLSLRLTDAGYEVWEADNGDDGLKIAREQRPDLIILDIMIPGIDGMTMSQKIKENIFTSDIPIIFLTGLQDKKTESLDFSGASNIVFAKPFDSKKLLEAIKKLIG